MVALERKFRRGERAALLEAVEYCVWTRIPIPEWARREYLRAFDAWKSYECRTLDEAFGVDRPKNLNLAGQRSRRKKQLLAWLRVSDLKNSMPLIEAFAKAAEELDISDSRARDYYYAQERRFQEV